MSHGDEATEAAQTVQIELGHDMNTENKGGAAASISRRGLLGAFAATAVAAAPTYAGAAGFLRGAGDIRSVKMHNARTGESMETVYWIEGSYIAEALAEINFFFRDWRRNEVKQIDNRTVDIIAATHRLVDAREPFLLLSGYRSPATNAMLRSRSSGVAKHSLHLEGRAADLRLSSRSVSQVSRAAGSCGAGGVGRYSGSNFTHVDCGQVRTWGS